MDWSAWPPLFRSVDSVYDINWVDDMQLQAMCSTRTKWIIPNIILKWPIPTCCLHFFDAYEKEAMRVIALGLVQPAYDYVLKCSHTFNLLDARGAISVTERTHYIARVRNMATASALKGVCEAAGSFGISYAEGSGSCGPNLDLDQAKEAE